MLVPDTDLQQIEHDLQATLHALAPKFSCQTAIILGSGLGAFAEQITDAITIPYKDIPHFPNCSVAGHAGNLLLGSLQGHTVLCMQGRLHWYEGCQEMDFHVPFLIMKLLGIQRVFITNASGAINPSFAPGDLVLVNDHINFQFRSPLVGYHDPHGKHFLDLHHAYDLALRTALLKTAGTLDIALHEGVYIGTLGPNFETPAEIRAYGMLGADLVGMSTLPEVITANFYGFKVAVIAIISNMAAGLAGQTLSHNLTLSVATQGAKKLTHLIQETIKSTPVEQA